MNITEIHIFDPSHKDKDGLLAYVEVIFDNQLKLRDVCIIRGTSRIFVAFPSRARTRNCHDCGRMFSCRDYYCPVCGSLNGQQNDHSRRFFTDIIYPITSETRNLFEAQILAEYAKHVESKRIEKSLVDEKSERT
jgi:DNA-binding cell septation regulator SpoVG